VGDVMQLRRDFAAWCEVIGAMAAELRDQDSFA
jgi:hypothetical protein